jgi:hypothetical protein
MATAQVFDKICQSSLQIVEAFTYLIHRADNRHTSRRYSLTMAHGQTSDAANRYSYRWESTLRLSAIKGDRHPEHLL